MLNFAAFPLFEGAGNFLVNAFASDYLIQSAKRILLLEGARSADKALADKRVHERVPHTL